jgi:hypothetical protein
MRRLILCTLVILLLGSGHLHGQGETQNCTIRDGRMYISLRKDIGLAELNGFMARYNLNAIGLYQFIRSHTMDSLKKLGWKVEMDKPKRFIISKPLFSSGNIGNPAGDILLTEKHPNSWERFPSVNNGIVCGYNRFRHKYPFAQTDDGAVTVYLRGNTQAGRVMLAGSFNNWIPNALAMTRTDSGWIALLHLSPGKYWYKFIIDGRWTTDTDNQAEENDGEGNTNSVFYVTNFNFVLHGYMKARKVVIAGSFNDWHEDQLRMVRTDIGWHLPVYLAEGTHTYRYIVDGEWMTDPGKRDRLPNEFGDYNSVIRIGKPTIFRLPGYQNAHQVILTGSFNRWRNDELYMQKTATGWELPYTLGPGNYEYHFIVDVQVVNDPGNTMVTRQDGKIKNSFLIIDANYTFHLQGYTNAASVFLAGDFDEWSPGTLQMRREGDGWTFSVHLSVGKHTYKYIVDGDWIRDPGNPLWEQNEFDTGNSIVWVEK